jgi:hypothetical protein
VPVVHVQEVVREVKKPMVQYVERIVEVPQPVPTVMRYIQRPMPLPMSPQLNGGSIGYSPSPILTPPASPFPGFNPTLERPVRTTVFPPMVAPPPRTPPMATRM